MKRIITTGILIVILTSFGIRAQTLDDAIQYLKQKNYVVALNVCNGLLVKSENDPSVLAIRSLTYTAMGRYEQAGADADKALSVDNTSDRARFAKAEVLYYGQKEYDKAIREYDAAINSNARMSEAYAGKARTYMAMQNYKEALNVAEDAVKKFPDDSESRYVRGLLNYQRGKYKPAVEDYDKALSLNEKWNPYQVYLNRGLAYEALMDYETALRDFSSAVSIDPNNSSAYIALGNIKYTLYRYGEAVDDFKKAEILSPDNSVITYNIGMSYFRNEDKSSACKYFQKSCSQGNNNACKMVVLNCSDRKIN